MQTKFIAFVAVIFCCLAASAAEYKIDMAHSQVGFKTKHVTGKVPGRFTQFTGSFTYDEKDPKSWKATASIDPTSINTDNEARDKHLKGPDFFDVTKCSTMTFVSTSVTDVTKTSAKLNGNLTMHCVTKPVTLNLEVNGVDKDPWGNVTASFSANTTIKRKDWDIVWNKTLDSGNFLVGEAVEISLEITGIAAKPEGKEVPTKPKK